RLCEQDPVIRPDPLKDILFRSAVIVAAKGGMLADITVGDVLEILDRYPIACRPIRDLLVAYLAERQPAIDYTTLVGLAYHLVRCFWCDIECHHPDINSLKLPREVAGAWKRRLRTKTTTVIRDDQRVAVES